MTPEKDNLAQVSKNLAGYESENNFELSK